MSSSIPLYIPYSMKDRVKNLQCKWDKYNRYWVANKSILEEHPELKKYTEYPINVFYNIPFKLKDGFKNIGGKWNNDNKQWYIMSNEDVPEVFHKFRVQDETELYPFY